MCNLSLGRRHLVSAYEVKAGIGVIAGNIVWSMRLECEVLQKTRYINTLTYTFIFTFLSARSSDRAFTTSIPLLVVLATHAHLCPKFKTVTICLCGHADHVVCYDKKQTKIVCMCICMLCMYVCVRYRSASYQSLTAWNLTSQTTKTLLSAVLIL